MSVQPWPPERVAALRELWASGLPMAGIGRRLGVTKNAVAGMAYRLDLDPRVARTRPRPGAPPWFGAGECAWPIGDPGDSAFRFCRAPRDPGCPYCAAHRERSRGKAA